VRAAVASRRAHLAAVRAGVVVSLRSPVWQGAGTCEGLLAARRPGALRLRGYAAVSTVFDAATDGARFTVALPPAGLSYVGPAGAESLLTGLPVPPGEIVAAVFGEPYGAADRTWRIEEEKGRRWVAWDLDPGHAVRALFGGSPVLLQRAELRRHGVLVARLAYHDYRKRDGLWWPARIEFDWPAEGAALTLDFTEVHLNPQLPDELFRPEVPASLVTVEVGRDSSASSAVGADADSTGDVR
jgi:hypothetical protein